MCVVQSIQSETASWHDALQYKPCIASNCPSPRPWHSTTDSPQLVPLCLQIAQDALSGAESAQAAASSRLQAVKARLPQPAPPPAQQDAAASGSNNADGSTSAGGEDDFAQPKGFAGGAGCAVVPTLKLQQLPPEEVTLSPEQRRALNEAQAGVEAADNELKSTKASASAAGARLTCCGCGFQQHSLGLVYGSPSESALITAAHTANPMRVVLCTQMLPWLLLKLA